MKRRVNPNILDVQPYIPGKPIEEVKRELKLKRVIKLASNENPYPPSPKVIAAIAKEAQNVNRYPDGGCFALREALAKHLKVKPEQLLFGNGSDELIVMAVRAFVMPGEEVVLAKPSFMIYEIASKVVGAKLKEVPLQDFRYDLAGMVKAVGRRTKIVFIGNPDNPSGTFITHSQAEALLQSIPSDVLVFFDEAYFEYVQNKEYPDTIALLDKHKNLIVTRTFSKMYGLAGLRVGYGIAHPEIVDLLNRVREPFNVNSLAQAAALACLKDQAYYRRIAKEIEEQRQYLYGSLDKLGLTYVRTATNFILVDVGRDSKAVSQSMMKKGVIVRDMSVWGLKTFIRVSIGTPAENKQFVQALQGVL